MGATASEPRVLERDPSSLPLMLKAALPAVPVLNQVPWVRRTGSSLPDLTLTRHDVPVDRARVAAYSEVCGFPLQDTLPVTYPHMLAFGLHMAIMTDSSFPVPAIGTVHLENAITQHRAISADERLQVTAHGTSSLLSQTVTIAAHGAGVDGVALVQRRRRAVAAVTARARGVPARVPDALPGLRVARLAASRARPGGVLAPLARGRAPDVRIAARLDSQRDARAVYRSLADLPEAQRAVVELVAIDGVDRVRVVGQPADRRGHHRRQAVDALVRRLERRPDVVEVDGNQHSERSPSSSSICASTIW